MPDLGRRDRVHEIGQRWLATMGLDDESIRLRAELERRVAVAIEEHGPRPPWWRPAARRAWDRWRAGLEVRCVEAMRAALD